MSDSNFIQLSVTDFEQSINNQETILIDIRTKEEWETYGTIPGTQKYFIFGNPLFEFQISKLDKNIHYLIYCWHGSRSKVATEMMRNLWFKKVHDLEWGIDAWITAGKKVDKK